LLLPVVVPAEAPVVPAVVALERPFVKYQMAAATMARRMMIHNQLTPPLSVVAGAAGDVVVAGGVA
jgi:hypothetical protein